jgi:hypothetical protein
MNEPRRCMGTAARISRLWRAGRLWNPRPPTRSLTHPCRRSTQGTVKMSGAGTRTGGTSSSRTAVLVRPRWVSMKRGPAVNGQVPPGDRVRDPGSGPGRSLSGSSSAHLSMALCLARDLVSGRLFRRPKFIAGRQATEPMAGPAGWNGSFLVGRLESRWPRSPGSDNLGERSGRTSGGWTGRRVAEREGFEPSMGCPIPHFQSGRNRPPRFGECRGVRDRT